MELLRFYEEICQFEMTKTTMSPSAKPALYLRFGLMDLKCLINFSASSKSTKGFVLSFSQVLMVLPYAEHCLTLPFLSEYVGKSLRGLLLCHVVRQCQCVSGYP
jgi:hypothetical protein